jgi:quinol---cytochrome-c reductase cytochrome c subunit
MRRAALLALALACAAASLWHFARAAPAQAPPVTGGASAAADRGRTLFSEGCASCHGTDAHGIAGRGPDLHGVGARSADFYLATGRMPLNNPREAPARHPPAYDARDRRALVAYVASLGGPPIPATEPARGSLSEGLRAFTEHCAGCHQVLARGGIVTGGVAPPLTQATPRQIEEAIRIGPYLMPKFASAQINDRTVDSIARYVLFATRHTPDRGGWGLGHIGPIPEGMAAWFLALAALLIVARLIGEGLAPRGGAR